MKAEHAQVSEVSDRLVADFYAKSVSCIIYESKIVPSSNVGQGIKFAGMTIDVYCQNGCCPGGDCSLNFFRIKGVILWFYIDEDRPDLVPEQGMSCSHKGIGSGDNLT